MKRRPPFARDLEREMRDPVFRAAYVQSRARIDAINRTIRELNDRREALGLSKAELARRVGANQAAIRRLFSAAEQNPTIGTLFDVAHALDLEIRVARVPARSTRPARTTAPRIKHTSSAHKSTTR